VDFSSRGRRTDEFLEIVRRLWAGETFSYQGKHFTLKDAAIVPAPGSGRIPLFLGGFTDKALARTAKYGDGYFGNEEVCELYLQKLRACGKDPGTARIRIQGLFVLVARDPEQALLVERGSGRDGLEQCSAAQADDAGRVQVQRHLAHPDAGPGHRCIQEDADEAAR
jgi:alkanesulfonate monooxygenase SsuD/methylene tetrahydromethanopterin reductase-like flavin-dependent oxidoreductase (luciferase family)